VAQFKTFLTALLAGSAAATTDPELQRRLLQAEVEADQAAVMAA